MDKAKGGQDQGWEVGMWRWVGQEASGGGEIATTVLEQLKIDFKKGHHYTFS